MLIRGKLVLVISNWIEMLKKKNYVEKWCWRIQVVMGNSGLMEMKMMLMNTRKIKDKKIDGEFVIKKLD